jgi:hypothetical protein
MESNAVKDGSQPWTLLSINSSGLLKKISISSINGSMWAINGGK